MPVYDRFINTALRLIKRYGVQVDWLGGDTYTTDPAVIEGASIARPKRVEAAMPQKCDIVFFPVDKDNQETLLRNGVEFIDGMQVGYMGAVDFEVLPSHRVLHNGSEMPIAHIDIIAPNGETVLHTIVFHAPIKTND